MSCTCGNFQMCPIASRDAPVNPENAARYTNLSQIGTRASATGVTMMSAAANTSAMAWTRGEIRLTSSSFAKATEDKP